MIIVIEMLRTALSPPCLMSAKCPNGIEWFIWNFIKANLHKFQAIHTGKKTHESTGSFKLGNTIIRLTTEQLLCYLEYVLKKHDSNYLFLNTLVSFLQSKVNLKPINLFIVANFSYCPITWHSCNQSSTNNMEKTKERAFLWWFWVSSSGPSQYPKYTVLTHQ